MRREIIGTDSKGHPVKDLKKAVKVVVRIWDKGKFTEYFLKKPGMKKADDWCASAGGKWITYKGKHICVGAETDSKITGYKKTEVIHSRFSRTEIHYPPSKRDEATRIKSAIQYYPAKVKSDISRVVIHEGLLHEDGGNTVGVNFIDMIELGDVPERDAERTLHHEIGHTIWNQHFKTPQHLSWSLLDEAPVSNYGSTSVQEDFCETLMIYKTNPAMLRSIRKEHLKLLERHMKELEK